MRFGGKWQKAEARIVDYHTRRDNLTGGWITDYVADVRPTDGDAFRVTFRHRRLGGLSTPTGDFAAPMKGEVCGVLFDPSSHDVKFDRDDPRLSLRAKSRAQEQAADERLRQAAMQPPGTPDSEEGSGQGVITIQPGDSMTIQPGDSMTIQPGDSTTFGA